MMIEQFIKVMTLSILSGFEIWLCYQFLFMFFFDKDHLKKKNRIMMWGSIVLLGILSGINRSELFFSSTVFLMDVIILTGCIWGIKKKDRIIGISLIIIFNAGVSLLDYFFAGLSYIILKDQFINAVFWGGKCIWLGLIFSCTRGTILLGGIFIRRRKMQRIQLSEYKWGLVGISILLLGVVRYWQRRVVGFVFKMWKLSGSQMSILILGSIIGIFLLMTLWAKYDMLQKENKFLILQEELLEEKYREMEKNAFLIHDMKHNLLALKSYADANEYDAMNRYLESICQEYYSAENTYAWTNNKLYNVIIQQKKSEANQQDIEMDIRASLEVNFPFDDREGCTILGNLLDNAIESCRKVKQGERWIRVSIRGEERISFLEITNSIEERPVKQGELFMTSKNNKRLHGYGMRSVKRIVDKYEGILLSRIEEQAFCISISFFHCDI